MQGSNVVSNALRVERITVQRSPARVCWWVMFHEVLLATRDTKWEAVELKNKLLKEDLV